MADKSFINKFKYAGRGLVYLWQREKSFRWQVLAAGGVQLVAWILKIEPIVWAVLILACVIVLCAEAFNTALERLLDMVEPRLSSQVSVLKNLLAAAVLIVALGAMVVLLVVLIN